MNEEVVNPPGVEAKSKPSFDWTVIVKSPAFVPGLALAVGFAVAFFFVLEHLPELWLSDDGYYSHGFLVPIISAYIVYRWWPRLKDIPVRPTPLAIVLVLLGLWGIFVSTTTVFYSGAAVSMLFTILSGIWFVAGFRWMIGLAAPVLYLIFALPMFGNIIDSYTNPLQRLSTVVSYQILEVVRLNPFQADATTIHLDNFTLDVGVPCSGLKLLLALTAFNVFFILIARLRWWANLLMLMIILPLGIGINGLRIALIGIVGNAYGPEAGHQFHDYSGYITLVVCFFILFKIARGLGWKD
ncbi:MAG: exosortase/archaeosortase family protein [Fimbriimonadaceae bacterium]